MKHQYCYKAALFTTVFTLLAGCGQVAEPDNTLTIIAGSELNDMAPVIEEAQKKLNLSIKISYATGTIDGVEQVKQGLQVDAAWFSQAKYFYENTADAKRIKLSEKIMLSPVVVGVRQASYDKLGITNVNAVTWKDISSWVTQYHLTYAMTDPSASNTGYVPLMGLAYANAGTGESLKPTDINVQAMKDFFAGHKIHSGSSRWLMEAFSKTPTDFVINYESVIMEYNKQHPQDKLQLIYPQEGISTSDYPLLLLNEKKMAQYQKLVEYLKSHDVQKKIMQTTSRRPIAASLMMAQALFDTKRLLVEMPFTPDSQVANQLLSAYYSQYKRPAAVAFVVDTSSSMAGNTGEVELKNAMKALTVEGNSSNSFFKIRPREKVWIVPFSTEVYGIQAFEVGTEVARSNSQINQYVSGLTMNGGTAIFSAVQAAMDILQQERLRNAQYSYSVILLTDGKNNHGISDKAFEQWLNQSSIAPGDIRIYPVLFGDASMEDMQTLARLSAGKVFDGTHKSLTAVFKEIRSYQ